MYYFEVGNTVHNRLAFDGARPIGSQTMRIGSFAWLTINSIDH